MAASQYYEQIQQAYLAYYGRPADPAGQAYWAQQLDNAGGNLSAIINAFGTSAESTALYGGSSAAAQVNAIYEQLFGRQADVTGLNFYVNGLENGQFTLASIALNVFNGAQGSDLTELQAKEAYADAFTEAVGDSVSAQIDYSGTAASNAARAAVSGVTSTATEATAVSALPTTISNMGSGAVGQTYTLTTGVDNIVLTGNNNVVNASDAGPFGEAQTWTGLDTITGTGTGNTFNVASASSISQPAGATVSGIQTANFTESTTGYVALDTTTGWTGLTSLNVTAAGGDVTLTAATTTNVTVLDAGTAFVQVDGGNNVTVNSDASVTIGYTTAPAGAITVNESAANSGGIIEVDGGTSVTVTASGSNVGEIDIGYYTTPTGTITVTDTGDNTDNEINVYSGSTVNVTVAGTDIGGVTVGNDNGSAPTYVTGAVTVNLTETAVPVTPFTPAGTESDAEGGITVWGGTTVSVTQNIDAPNVVGTTGMYSSNYGGEVEINGSSATTSVTVNQSAAVEAVEGTSTVAAVGGVYDGYVEIYDVNGGTAKSGTITSVTLNNYSDGAYIEDNALTTLTIGGTAGGLEIYDAGGLATPVTTLALNLNALTATPGDTGTEAADDTTVTEYAGVIKTLNIVTGGASASTLTFGDGGLTTVNISGSQNINLTTTTTEGFAAVYATAINVSGAAGVTTAIDAATAFDSTAAGNDVLTLNGALTKTSGGSITFGSGDNSLLAGADASIAAGVTIDGGTSGHNTISASLINAGNSADILNFQTLDVSGYSSTLDASLLSTPISGVAISTGTTDATLQNLAAAVTVTDTYAGDDSTLTLTHAGTSTTSLAVNFASPTTSSTQDLAITSTDDSAVTVSSGGAKGDVNTLSLAETDNHLSTVTITGADGLHLNLNLDTTDTGSTTTPTANIASALTTIDGSAATGALTITAGATHYIDGSTTYGLTFTGLTIHGGTGGDAIENDANNGTIIEGATAAETTTNTAHNDLTVTGSHATINDSASAANDTIYLGTTLLPGQYDSATLGSGSDTAYLNGYSDSLTLGSGTGVNVYVANDTFGTASAPLLGEVSTVTFGSGTTTVDDSLAYNVTASASSSAPNGDILVLNGSLTGNTVNFQFGTGVYDTVAFSGTTTGTALGTAATVSTAQTFDQAVFDATSMTANKVTWFQYGGNTYVVDSGAQVAAETTQNTALADVVKITGTVDLSHATAQHFSAP